MGVFLKIALALLIPVCALGADSDEFLLNDLDKADSDQQSFLAPAPAPAPSPTPTPEVQSQNHAFFEIVGGSLTYHIVAGTSQLYSNKVSSDGRLISNFLYGVGVGYLWGGTYLAGRFFKGNNSVGQPINGGVVSVGGAYTYLDIGFIIGGYVQNDYDFMRTTLQPFSINTGSNAVVPIVGIEVNPKLPLGDHLYLKLNNILTPILTNTTLSLGIIF